MPGLCGCCLPVVAISDKFYRVFISSVLIEGAAWEILHVTLFCHVSFYRGIDFGSHLQCDVQYLEEPAGFYDNSVAVNGPHPRNYFEWAPKCTCRWTAEAALDFRAAGILPDDFFVVAEFRPSSLSFIFDAARGQPHRQKSQFGFDRSQNELNEFWNGRWAFELVCKCPFYVPNFTECLLCKGMRLLSW